MANVAAAYQASKGSPLDVDRAFYQRIAHEHGLRTLVDKLVVPIRSGRAWHVPAGHVFRIVTIDGPQVGDLNIWNYHNPRERMAWIRHIDERQVALRQLARIRWIVAHRDRVRIVRDFRYQALVRALGK